MRTFPYHNIMINEYVTNQDEQLMLEDILSSNDDRLDYHVTDYNTKINLYNNFKLSSAGKIMRKAILYRQRELDAIDLKKSEQGATIGESLLGLIGSAALGWYVGDKLASIMRVGVDINKIK